MSFKFFRNQRALFRFDPETCETSIYEKGKWLESNDPNFLNEIRFKTEELSISEALAMTAVPSVREAGIHEC